SAMRMELTRIVSERLNLPETLAERTLAEKPVGGPVPSGRRAGGPRTPMPAGPTADGDADGLAPPAAAGAGGGGASAGSVAFRGESTERAFLALCIAIPDAGERALGEVDPSEHFTSDAVRRAVGHLRAHLSDPGAELPEQDPELSALVAELVVAAGRESPRPEMLKVQRLQLELARLDRYIPRARGQERGDVRELARRRAEVQREFDSAYERALEETGESAV